MHVWHATPDAPPPPPRVIPGEHVAIPIGTWPIEPRQAVSVSCRTEGADATVVEHIVDAKWQQNQGPNSYWRADLGPFRTGDHVTYVVEARSPNGSVHGPTRSFRVGPRLYLAILWHQHQPIYKDTTHAPKGSYRQPWLRLHAIRDYYAMAALVADHPDVHLTINLTPSLLWQIEDYLERGATDRALDLTVTPAERLKANAREAIQTEFFDADWHNQIFPHARYAELFQQRQEGRAFSAQDLRDLQMWFNLAWFGQELRHGSITLATGEIASVSRFVEQARGFTVADVQAMVAEQFKVMRAIVPVHRQLQTRGQIEVSTTPFFHPILPLLVDTDAATIDRPGAAHPHRFAHPEDAEAQVRSAVDLFSKQFGHPPDGMWPAEGAVSQSVIPLFARHGVQWIATDKGVLARSGRWGYDVNNPDVLCQPYRAEGGEHRVAVFFRDSQLSDEIGFHYHQYPDPRRAAEDFLGQIRNRFARRVSGSEDRLLTIILDGENAWSAYRDDARPFLHALYGLLERDAEIETVTFSEYLHGNAGRGLASHAAADQTRVHDLFTGSWIDENGSAPGVDLGTWIGEEEENRGWERLGDARDAVDRAGATPDAAPAAFEALHIAEGSDWFWWFGADQDSGNDDEFDDLFRTHLRNVYRGLGRQAPKNLADHIVPHAVLWTFARPVDRIQPGDRLTIRTNCPGVLTWRINDEPPQVSPLRPAGGVMAGVQRHHVTLGPFPERVQDVHFRFRCTHRGCDGRQACCRSAEYAVRVTRRAGTSTLRSPGLQCAGTLSPWNTR